MPGRVEEDGQDRLPGGERFAFWEKTPVFTREYHVNPSHPQACDENDGSPEHPFATIQAAANLAGRERGSGYTAASTGNASGLSEAGTARRKW